MTITTVKQYGAVARAMDQVHRQKPHTGELRGTIACTACGSRLTFAIQADGKSRGQCARGPRCAVRWDQ